MHAACSVRELIVVRHGESEGNVEGIASGRQPSPLTERGQEQARRVARVVQGTGWTPAEIVTSPIVRCVQTARIVSDLLELPEARQENAFREIDHGEAEGRRFSEITLDGGRPPPRWEGFKPFGGESVEELTVRVGQGLDALPDDAHILLVTHGAVFKSVLAHLLGLDARFFLELRNGTCMRLSTRETSNGPVWAWTHHLHAEEWTS